MSKHQVHTQGRVAGDLRRLTTEELIDLYGIEIYDDGVVYDPTEDLEFDSLNDWATYLDELDSDDNYGQFSKIGSKQGFDDDGY